MITRKLTAICAALFLVTISKADARPHTVTHDFCWGNCGQYRDFYQPRKLSKRKAHRVKKVRVVHVAAIRKQPTGEAPTGLVANATRYLGMNAHQVGVRSTLWCSAFIRKLTDAKGVDDRAISWLKRPRVKPSINAIAITTRTGGYHVGIVKGFTKRGDVILISGNHSRRVGIGTYSKHRVIAYVSA